MNRRNDVNYIFMSRSFWDELEIPRTLLNKKFTEYLGESNRTIRTCEEAIDFISPIIDSMQRSFLDRMKIESSYEFISKLYVIFNKCFFLYMGQKQAREKLVNLNVSDSTILEAFEQNKNISLNLISAVNLWLENALLHQNGIETVPAQLTSIIDPELLIDLYLYGLFSRVLSYMTLSKKHKNIELFYGIDIVPNEDEPVIALKYHPIIYFNPLLIGNQKVFSVTKEDYKNADNSDFGKGFLDEYGIGFLLSLRIISTIQKNMLKQGKRSCVIIQKSDFIKTVRHYSINKIDPDKFFNAFVLTKGNLNSQLRHGEPIVWKMGTNKFRHELRPFLCLDNDNIIISYPALEQAKNIWLSYFANGGMIYTNIKDQLTASIDFRNNELSEELVRIIKRKLNEHYDSSFDEVNVDYKRIFGAKEYDYGDYDLVFFCKQVNELFLIEAKFFSDSLNSSGTITDYEKMFRPNGYYEHCRKRYDLALQNPDRLKAFVGASGNIQVHFLFVSSKPLEIEFIDKDDIVVFPCLSILDKYLEGKLISEDGKYVVRPTHIL